MIGELVCVKSAVTLSKYVEKFNCFEVTSLGEKFTFSGRCMGYEPIIIYHKPKGEDIMIQDKDGTRKQADVIIDGFPYKFWFDDRFEKDGKYWVVPVETYYDFDMRDKEVLLENAMLEQASYTLDDSHAKKLLNIAYPGTEIAGILKRVYLVHPEKIERIEAINFEDAAQLQFLLDNHADLKAVILTKTNVEVHLPLKLLKVYETPS